MKTRNLFSGCASLFSDNIFSRNISVSYLSNKLQNSVKMSKNDIYEVYVTAQDKMNNVFDSNLYVNVSVTLQKKTQDILIHLFYQGKKR
ncbi:hypothetical protein N9L02_01270 [Gammaproteobacteria bacterium]|nr:hypothetical protein [Gammaproteobacteria bacterium]